MNRPLDIFIFLIILILFLSIITSCSKVSDLLNPRWTAIVYPNGDNLTSYLNLGDFNSFEECRNACVSWLKGRGAAYSGDYECGKNCKPSEYGVLVCEETRD